MDRPWLYSRTIGTFPFEAAIRALFATLKELVHLDPFCLVLVQTDRAKRKWMENEVIIAVVQRLVGLFLYLLCYCMLQMLKRTITYSSSTVTTSGTVLNCFVIAREVYNGSVSCGTIQFRTVPLSLVQTGAKRQVLLQCLVDCCCSRWT